MNTFKTRDEVIEFRKAFGMNSLDDGMGAFERLNMGLDARGDRRRSESELVGAMQEIAKSMMSDEARDFLKTMSSNASGITDVLNLVGGAALSVQSLDTTMASIVQDETEYAFLNSCHRSDVANTMNEYNTILAHRHQRRPGSVVSETGDPMFDDPVIKRNAHNIAFLAQGFSMSRPIRQINTTEDPASISEQSAIQNVLETLASLMWYGDRSLIGIEFDGFQSMLEDDASLVVDAEGSLPDVKDVKEQTTEIRRNFGMASDFWMPVGTQREWDNYLIANSAQRKDYNGNNTTEIGHIVPGIADSNARDAHLKFRSDLWMNRFADGVPEVYDDNTGTWIEGPEGVKPPNAPASVVVADAGASASSKWKAGDVVAATLVHYRISAVGADGSRSAASAAAAINTALDAGDYATVTITPDNTGPQTVAFDIYRETVPGNGIYKFVRRVSRNTGGATTVFSDFNLYRPGCDIGVLGDFNSKTSTGRARTYALGQLLPLMRTQFPEGVVNLRKLGGMVEFYGGLRLYAPKKFRLYRNLPA